MGYDKTLSLLIKQFLCCTPINVIDQTFQNFHHNGNCVINIDGQKEILRNTVNSNLVKQYPMKHSYQKAFLKWLMKKIEDCGEEIYDDLYITYCNLVSISPNEPTHYRHVIVENGTLDYILLQESTHIISDGTTGLCSWQGAVGLSKWCQENKSNFLGKTVLELGCGVGLAGLNIISTCAPKEYIFSDCHPAVLKMVCTNARLNLLPCKEVEPIGYQNPQNRTKLHVHYEATLVKVIELKWEEISSYIAEGGTVPDVIIAADILYESSSFDALVAGLKALLSFENRYAIIAATIRNADSTSQFLNLLGKFGLAFEECSLPDYIMRIQLANSPIRILKIYKKS